MNNFAAYLGFSLRLLARPRQGRHLWRWLASLAPGAMLRNPYPWLVFDAVDYLNPIDMRGWRIFEYGSGASTLYWLRKGARLTSVEHDAAWYEQVRARLPAGADVDYRLAPPEPPESPRPSLDPADPAACVSANYVHDGLTYRRYVAQVDGVADGSLDLAVVDGRARSSCLVRAAPKVRPGGLLILDNSEREYYTRLIGEALESFTPMTFKGLVPQVPVFSQTTIYVRRP